MTIGECADRVCIVTGAGRGLGRAYALRLAEQGAAVVVNDIGASIEGDGRDTGPGAEVVEEIVAAGGRAVLNTNDVSDFDGARTLVEQAVSEFGGLDVLVNNAGILRDRTITRMTEDEWDSVIRVHLKGTFATSHFALNHWRERAKDEQTHARLINTTSVSGLFGNVGQGNYAAAKAGIAAFTTVASLEAERYGVTVNAVSPGAATRMTDTIPGRSATADDDSRSPRWVAAVVSWLASRRSDGVTGRVFLTSGKRLAVAEGWHVGPATTPLDDPLELDSVVRTLLDKTRPEADLTGADRVR